MNFFNIEGLSKNKLVLLFILKIIAGAIFFAIYTFHYQNSDFQTFFSDSKILVNNFLGKTTALPMENWVSQFEPVLFNNSKTMVLLNAIIQLFSFGNIYVHVLFFCFFSFMGLSALFKAFVKHFPQKKTILIIAVFCVPSVLFWSSGILKESVVTTLLGLLIYLSDFGLKSKYSLSEKVLVLAIITLIAFVKFYVFLALLPLMFTNYLISKTSSKHFFLKHILVFCLAVLILFAAKIINADYNVLQLIADKQAKAISESKGGIFLVNDTYFICIDFNDKENSLLAQPDSTFKIKQGSTYLRWKLDNMADTTFVTHSSDTSNYTIYYSIQPANTVRNLTRIKPNVFDFILTSPHALINALFQPTLFNIKSWLHLVAAIENVWIAFAIILAILFFDKKGFEQKEVLIFCMLFSIVIFILIGITTPAIGALVRYRTIGLLFFVPAVLIFIDEEKLKKKLFNARKGIQKPINPDSDKGIN